MASGFPGKRVDAYLAGIIPINFIRDRQGEVVYQAELSGLSSFYASSSDSSAPTDWLVVGLYRLSVPVVPLSLIHISLL